MTDMQARASHFVDGHYPDDADGTQIPVAPVKGPFGGTKASGVSREISKVAILHRSELKFVYVSVNEVEAAY